MGILKTRSHGSANDARPSPGVSRSTEAKHTMSLVHIPPEIQAEFTIGSDGSVTVSRRALARLCGVSDTAIRSLLLRIKGANLEGSKTLESIAGQSFKGANLKDRAAACIINYYAHEAGRYKTDQALSVALAFSAIGLRSWVQSELGWKPQKREPQDDLRLSSTEVRKATMDALHAAGFTESRHYINVTTAAYMGLLGMSAKALRKDRGLPDGCNARDHLTEEELAALRLIEINLKETLRVIEFTRSSDVNQHIKSVAASIRASLAAGAVRGQLPG